MVEHFAGKWPFFLNPRQVMCVPVHQKHNDYAEYVALQMRRVGGLYAEADVNKGANMKKKISNALLAKFSFVAVVGDSDQDHLTVALRARDVKEADLIFGQEATRVREGTQVLPLVTCIELLKKLNMPCSQDLESYDAWEGRDPKNHPETSASLQQLNPIMEAAVVSRVVDVNGESASQETDFEAVLGRQPYVVGFKPTVVDLELFCRLSKSGRPERPNLLRWFEHVQSFTPSERASWPQCQQEAQVCGF